MADPWRAWFGEYATDDPTEVGDLDEFLQGILGACGYDSGDALESYAPLLEHVVGLVANTITGLRAHMTPEQRAAFDDDYCRKFRPVGRPTMAKTQDADGVWRQAIPLPFYAHRLVWKLWRPRWVDTFICGRCSVPFDTEQAYRDHYRSDHPEANDG